MDADEPPGLTEIAAELYAASPEEFVGARTARVKAARAAGDRALATAVGALRRPTRSAWLVNLLCREAAEELSALLALGAALRDAQEQLAADDLRRLSRERHRAVDALARRAADLGRAHGYQAPDAAQQEVSTTLQAALADPSVGRQVEQGTLAQAVAYGGFGPFDLAAAAAPVRAAAKPSASASSPKSSKATAEARGEDSLRARAEQRASEAAKDARLAAEAVEEARQASSTATAEADRLAEEVDELRRRLAEAEDAARQAEREARAARKELDRRTTVASTARQAAERATADLNARQV